MTVALTNHSVTWQDRKVRYGHRVLQFRELTRFQLWSHFVAHWADPRGINYSGEIAGPWLNNIPALGIQASDLSTFLCL